MSSRPWKWWNFPNGQKWRRRHPLFDWLDEEYIQRDHELNPVALIVPGRPELCPLPPSSYVSAAGLSNPTRDLPQLLACGSFTRIEVYRVGSGDEAYTVMVDRPAQQPPEDGKLFLSFCGTPGLASAGAAIKSENQTWMLRGKKKA